MIVDGNAGLFPEGRFAEEHHPHVFSRALGPVSRAHILTASVAAATRHNKANGNEKGWRRLVLERPLCPEILANIGTHSKY